MTRFTLRQLLISITALCVGLAIAFSPFIRISVDSFENSFSLTDSRGHERVAVGYNYVDGWFTR